MKHNRCQKSRGKFAGFRPLSQASIQKLLPESMEKLRGQLCFKLGSFRDSKNACRCNFLALEPRCFVLGKCSPHETSCRFPFISAIRPLASFLGRNEGKSARSFMWLAFPQYSHRGSSAKKLHLQAFLKSRKLPSLKQSCPRSFSLDSDRSF